MTTEFHTRYNRFSTATLPADPRGDFPARSAVQVRMEGTHMTVASAEQAPTALTRDALRETISRGHECLLGMQKTSGEWCGELEGDSILESEYIMLMHSIGKTSEPIIGKIAARLRNLQTPEGGWSIYPGAPNDVSASVLAYFALKLMGDKPGDLRMIKARAAILELGGVAACNTFTKIYLAIFGQYDWEHVPAIAPELVLLPSWFYLNIYAMSSWSRTILVPLAVIWHHRPHFDVPEEACIDELFVGGRQNADLRLRCNCPFPSWRHFFLMCDRVQKKLNSLPVRPWRVKALIVAESWMKERFHRSAGLGAIFPPIVNSIWAFQCLGYSLDSPEVSLQLKELSDLILDDEDSARMQPCTSPVWDTAIACIALQESGLPADHPCFEPAANWILDREVRIPGDWAVARPNLKPGGWYFEYANEYYPDVDDTAMVLMALHRMGTPREGTVQRAIDWVLGMQCRGGGWAAFDADNNRALLCEVPFADHNAMIDPPSADITGRVLEMLGVFGYDRSHPAVSSAIEFLCQEQEPDGSWFGRWGVNYIYGTWQVVKGLASVGLDGHDPMLRHAVRWILSVQNSDGGWGESCWSYHDPTTRGQGVSTASQTAWAVMGLIAAGEGASPAVRSGIGFLVRTQNEDGNWTEDVFTGTGFPKVFYLKYHLYRLYFPLFALGMYAHATGMAFTGDIGSPCQDGPPAFDRSIL